MKFSLLLLLVSFYQEVPFKAKEEFELKLDYDFKQRPMDDRTVVRMDETAAQHVRRTSASGMLPYLVVRVNVLQDAGAARVKITNNLNVNLGSKKVKEGLIVPVVFGFTDDVKDRVTPYEYTLSFISAERKELSRIVLFIEKDGTFIVNGEVRGRF